MTQAGHPITWLGYACVATAALAVLILAVYLWKKPPLDLRSKLWLFVGLGVLPGMSATTSTVTGMQATTQRHFCGSCHVMTPYLSDAGDPDSQSLAARHGRNPFFGDRNCYICHADYGMYGYPMTKLNGMGHVYEYYIGGWRNYGIEEALEKIHLRKPYDNTNCRQCHSGTLADWGSVPEHVALEQELASNVVSCASAGCHGYAHPFNKEDGGAARGLPKSAIGTDKPDRPTPSSLPPELRDKVDAEKKKFVDAEAERQAELERLREEARKKAKEAAKVRSEDKAQAGGKP
jgi:cytochrome c-type protein NapC